MAEDPRAGECPACWQDNGTHNPACYVPTYIADALQAERARCAAAAAEMREAAAMEFEDGSSRWESSERVAAIIRALPLPDGGALAERLGAIEIRRLLTNAVRERDAERALVAGLRAALKMLVEVKWSDGKPMNMDEWRTLCEGVHGSLALTPAAAAERLAALEEVARQTLGYLDMLGRPMTDGAEEESIAKGDRLRAALARLRATEKR